MLLVLGSVCSYGQQDFEQQGRAVLDKAASVLLTRTDNFAFHETVSFVIHTPSQPDSTGVDQKDYLDSDHHREHLIGAAVDQIWVTNAKQTWLKNPKFIPYGAIAHVRDGAPPCSLYQPDWRVQRIFEIPGQAGVECLEFKDVAVTECFDSDGLLLRKETPTLQLVYLKYQTLGSKKVPTAYKLELADGQRADAVIEYAPGDDIKPEMFVPPPSAGLTPGPMHCKSSKAPVITSSPDPRFPEQGKEGVVVLWAVIGMDGKAHDVTVVRSLTPANDREAINTVSGWRFKPSQCEGQPIDARINIEINFKKYQ